MGLVMHRNKDEKEVDTFHSCAHSAQPIKVREKGFQLPHLPRRVVAVNAFRGTLLLYWKKDD